MFVAWSLVCVRATASKVNSNHFFSTFSLLIAAYGQLRQGTSPKPTTIFQRKGKYEVFKTFFTKTVESLARSLANFYHK